MNKNMINRTGKFNDQNELQYNWWYSQVVLPYYEPICSGLNRLDNLYHDNVPILPRKMEACHSIELLLWRVLNYESFTHSGENLILLEELKVMPVLEDKTYYITHVIFLQKFTVIFGT